MKTCIKCGSPPKYPDKWLMKDKCRVCYRHDYHIENKEFENANNKIWRLNNSDYFENWRKNNPERVKELNTKYYQLNREEVIKANVRWARNNPEKRFVIEKRYFEKLNLPKHWSIIDYRRLLRTWSNVVKNRDNRKCQICFKPAKISHHIFYKNRYPELSLNINNGISLCNDHHREIHILNGEK